MTTKGFIVLLFIGLAILLFAAVGFDVVSSSKYNLVALGLCSQAIAAFVNWFMPGGLTS